MQLAIRGCTPSAYISLTRLSGNRLLAAVLASRTCPVKVESTVAAVSGAGPAAVFILEFALGRQWCHTCAGHGIGSQGLLMPFSRDSLRKIA